MKLQLCVLFITGLLFAGCKKDPVDELSGTYRGSVTYDSPYGSDVYAGKFRIATLSESSFNIISENFFNGKEGEASRTFAYKDDGDYIDYRTSGYVESFSAKFPMKDSLVVEISRWSSAGQGGRITQGVLRTFRGKK